MQQLESWPTDTLIEYARNPRKNDHAVDRVAAAIMVWITVGVSCICLSIIFLMCVYLVGYIYYFAFTDYFSLVQTVDADHTF